jgi:tetratricopeptide (TPR) repeat protein
MDILVRLGDVKAAELEAQADCHFVKREFQDAQGCLLQAAAIRNNDGDLVSAGNCAQKIGLVRYFLGDQTGAILSYEEAFEFRRRVDDLLGQGVTLGRMAEVFQRGGQHAKALELLEDSIRFFTQVNATKDIGTVLHNMALVQIGVADRLK